MNDVNMLAAEAEMAVFVNCLFEPSDLVEYRLISSGGGKPQQEWRHAANPIGLIDWLACMNDCGYCIYAGANPRSNRAGCSSDVLLARSLFVDFDGLTMEVCLERCCNIGQHAPTMIVATGGGFHFYWKLNQPMTDLAEWTATQRALIAAVGSDPKIHDAPRIMRVPGFVNTKPNRYGAMATLIDCRPERTYSLDLFPKGIA